MSLNSSGFEKGIKSASKQGGSLAESLKGSIGGAATFVSNKVSATTVALGNLMADATKAVASASKDLVQSVFEEYANTEQLYGGVETIFKGSADTVKKYASEAFATAGMSANEYMQTVTSFSSSLLQGLNGDTAKAAEVADMAIRDMSDNANKFGTDIGLIQNAYQGFAKDNFTMLDNLKLGYGGTQAEMARLINDSGVLGDTLVTAANVSEVPLDKMFEAIHIIQTEMEVTGTTAKESADTISGSFASFKATWRNLLSGLADNKDVDALVDNFFDTGENLITNVVSLLPRIGENTLTAFDSFLSRWDVYNDIKAAFKDKGLAGVVSEVKTFATEAFSEWGPIAYQAGTDLLAGIYSGLTGNATTGDEIRAVLDGIWIKAQGAIDIFVDAGSNVISSIYTGITGDTSSEKSINEKLSTLWETGKTTVSGFVDAASGVLGDIYEGMTGEEMSVDSINNLLSGLFTQGQGALDTYLGNAKGLLSGIYEGMTGDTAKGEIGVLLGELFAEGTTAMSNLKTTAGSLLGSIYTTLTGQEATAENIGKTIGGVFNAGITAAENVLGKTKTFFEDLNDVLGDPDASIGEKIKGVFDVGATGLSNLLQAGGTFLSDLYAAITNDTESAAKIEEFTTSLFETPEKKMERQKAELGDMKYDRSEWKYFNQSEVMEMLGTLGASGLVSESTFDEWSAIVRQGVGNEDYSGIADAIIMAYREAQEAEAPTAPEETESETSSSFLSDITSAVNQAVEAGTAAASIPITLTVHTSVDGQEIANIITPKAMAEISRQIMQRRYTGG